MTQVKALVDDLMKALGFELAKFDPDQPRDEIGRWTDAGGGGGLDSADAGPKMPPHKFEGPSGKVAQRGRERARIMEGRYSGVKFSSYQGNPLGIKEARKIGQPGVGLPNAIFNQRDTVPVNDPDKIAAVKESAKRWGGNVVSFVSYTAVKEDTGLSYQDVFGAVKAMHLANPGSISFSVNRLGESVYFGVRKAKP